MSDHHPRPGIRNSYVCDKCAGESAGKEGVKGVPKRVFAQPGDPTPRCDKHGVMKRQGNRDYKGQSTS